MLERERMMLTYLWYICLVVYTPMHSNAIRINTPPDKCNHCVCVCVWV